MKVLAEIGGGKGIVTKKKLFVGECDEWFTGMHQYLSFMGANAARDRVSG